jgi:hypothetical protein
MRLAEANSCTPKEVKFWFRKAVHYDVHLFGSAAVYVCSQVSILLVALNHTI